MERVRDAILLSTILETSTDIISHPGHLKMYNEAISVQNKVKTTEKMNNKTTLY